MKKPFTIGISGGSASGKTFFLKSLLKSFSEDELCLISQDEYYRAKEEQPLDANGIPNFDSPFSIDVEQFSKDLAKIKSGQEVQKLEYTFNNPGIKPRALVFKPAPILLAEGIFVFYHPQIAEQLDLKIFLDAKEHIKLRRRLSRDQQERGYDFKDVLYRYEHHVAPTYEKYIEPFKYEADIIIPNNHQFEKALDMLVVYLKNKI